MLLSTVNAKYMPVISPQDMSCENSVTGLGCE